VSTPLYKRIERNQHGGRDLIAGDIHGTLTKFMAALHATGFDPDAGDRLFLVGDLVDRGPESARMLDLLRQHWVHAVRGNHEQMAIEWANGTYDDAQNYIANGGAWFMALTKPEQREFADAFDALPYAIELETEGGLVGIVHAECPFDSFRLLETALAAEPSNRFESIKDCCIWSRSRIEDRHEGEVTDVRAVVVGHTPMENWTSLGNHIYIDTMGWRGRQFTFLDAATLQPVKYSPVE
jgi:serine/threonine protein phosphatase 1